MSTLLCCAAMTGDTPWHMAQCMGHEEAMKILEKVCNVSLSLFYFYELSETQKQ